MTAHLNKGYWEDRWKNDLTGWDVGYASPALTVYFDSLNKKATSILIPGCGSAYEAEYLHKGGFDDVTIIDISPTAIERYKKRRPDFPEDKVICGDFFKHQGQYELIMEQTFFCALPPTMREDYVRGMHRLLAPSGLLMGLLFDFPLTEEGPPFGGSEDEYRSRFEPFFDIVQMKRCGNSIKPRSGSELFILMRRKL